MTFALTVLMSHLGPMAVLLLAAIVFTETGLLVGFFLPGDSILFAAGLLVANGTVPVAIGLVIAVLWLSAALGDQTGYWIGERLGRPLLDGRPRRWLPVRHVDAAREFFARHGAKAVLIARFVPLVRTVTPVIAGSVGMSRRRFTAYNIVGGLVWTAGVTLAGYFLGAIPVVSSHVELIILGIDAIAVVPALVAFWLRRRSGAAGPNEAAPEQKELVGV